MNLSENIGYIYDDKILIKFLTQESLKRGIKNKNNIPCSHCGSLKNFKSSCCIELNQCYICHELETEYGYWDCEPKGEKLLKLYKKRDKTNYNKNK